MKDICPANKCTGCYACVNACPKHCISMKEDALGALHPFVDNSLCVDCNLCIKSCPNNNDLEFTTPIGCYASWIMDKPKRRICASGGIGTILSEYVINNNGVVFGSRYDENLNPVMAYNEDLKDLDYFKGSRYVQSKVGDSYTKVKEFLKKDRLVIYIGTPCQIAGLKTYLKKDYINLVTVDLICHGVCPSKYLKEEVESICIDKNISKITDVRFRGNDGNNFALTLWNGNKCLYKRSAYESYYLGGFLLGVSMRENCYTCNYARPERISDITIGDFIGLGKVVPFNYKEGNVSSVIINTEKGKDFYKCVSDSTPSLQNVLRTYEERLNYKPSLVHPFERHPLNAVFVQKYKEGGYLYAIKETLNDSVKKHRRKRLLNYWKLIYKVPRKIVKILITK